MHYCCCVIVPFCDSSDCSFFNLVVHKWTVFYLTLVTFWKLFVQIFPYITWIGCSGLWSFWLCCMLLCLVVVCVSILDLFGTYMYVYMALYISTSRIHVNYVVFGGIKFLHSITLFWRKCYVFLTILLKCLNKFPFSYFAHCQYFWYSCCSDFLRVQFFWGLSGLFSPHVTFSIVDQFLKLLDGHIFHHLQQHLFCLKMAYLAQWQKLRINLIDWSCCHFHLEHLDEDGSCQACVCWWNVPFKHVPFNDCIL